MAFNTIEISTQLNTETIIQLIQTNTHPKDASWNVKEFDNKNTLEKTYTSETSKNTFTLRARKTNQRRQSRPIGYGEISTNKKNTTIHITVIPHIGSIIIWLFFLFFSLVGLIHSITTENYFSIIPGVLIPTGLVAFFYLNLKYDTKDMRMFVQKIIK